jgi:hypothetical protein
MNKYYFVRLEDLMSDFKSGKYEPHPFCTNTPLTINHLYKLINNDYCNVPIYTTKHNDKQLIMFNYLWLKEVSNLFLNGDGKFDYDLELDIVYEKKCSTFNLIYNNKCLYHLLNNYELNNKIIDRLRNIHHNLHTVQLVVVEG